MNPASTRLSVAMCTYNGARYLEEQLQSLAAQQRLPDELVACDDGSTDETVALLERFSATAPFPVRIVRNPENLGFRRNFAQALDLCTGDLIALCDQDDVWYPPKLRVLEELLARHPAAEGVFSDGDILDAQSQSVERTLWQSFRFFPASQRRFQAGRAIDELLRRNMVTGMAFMIRSSARHLLRNMPASWIHDGWLAFLIALRSDLLACPERLVGYRVYGRQQVGTPPTDAAKIRSLQTGGLGSYSRRVRALNLDEYQRTDRQFADLLGYLQQQRIGSSAVQAAVRAKQQHAARGAATLSGRRLGRFGILGQLRSYARFAPNGWRGVLRDLVI